MGDWAPEKQSNVGEGNEEESYLSSKFYLWTIPTGGNK
jgi:hypothetical protein